jgi:hypothetical protein
MIFDDTDAELSGAWSHSQNFKPHIENGYIFSGEKKSRTKGDGKSTATFRYKVSKSGEYELLMAYSAHETRATNVPVVVTSSGKMIEFSVDQTKAIPIGQHFRSLGKVHLERGDETVITISNRQTQGFVIVDALQLIPKQQ